MHYRNKKKITIMLLVVMCTMLLLTPATMVAAEEEEGVGSLQTKVETAQEDIVKAIQDIAKILAVIFIAWAGVIMWGSGGDPQKKAAAKDKLLYFLIAVFMITTAQPIVETIWGWLT